MLKKLMMPLATLMVAVGVSGYAVARTEAASSTDAGFSDKDLYEMGYAIKHITPVTPELTDMALKLLRASAAMGNAEAMVQMGEMYLAGRVPLEKDQDTNQEAMKWWNMAWDHGASRAYHNLGLMYYGVPVPGTGGKGVGVVKQDYDRAFKYFKAAADRNDSKALRYVGICYENGQGVKQDYAAAARYYEKDGAGYYLANLLLEGKGVKQDVNRAIELYKDVAAKNGGGSADQYSAEALARIYEEGRYVAADQSMALKYYQMAAGYGSASAKARLTDYAADLYKKGYAQLTGGNYGAALPMLLTSASLGNADALKMTGAGKK